MNHLPDWLCPEDWEDYRSHRKAIKKPLTEIAERRAIKTLAKLMAEGHNPADVIHQSIVNGWAGLFPLKDHAGKPQEASTIDDTMRRAAARAERIRKMLGKM